MPDKKILVIGSSNTDMTVRVHTMPAPGETVMGGAFTMNGGGKGANQAVAAKRLGADVTLLCKVGGDVFGDESLRSFAREGIDISHVLRSDLPSGVALIMVDDSAENTIAVAPGANSDITPSDIEANESLIATSDIVLLQLEIPMESVLAAARIASSHGCYVILNPAPAAALPEEIFRYVDLITPNSSEAAFYAGLSADGKDSVDAAAGVLLSKGAKAVLITLGSKGSAIFCNGERTDVPARKVKAVDTTAAGDTFCGALAVAISEGQSLTDAAVFASAASSLTVQRVGAQASIPLRSELDAIL